MATTMDRHVQETQAECLWRLHGYGYNLIPVDGKHPPLVRWKQWQTERIGKQQLLKWQNELRKKIDHLNWGLLTGATPYSQAPALIVIDADDQEADDLVAASCPPTPVMQRTGKGVHRVYLRPPMDQIPSIGNRQGIVLSGKLFKVDVRGDGGYILAPGSIHPRTKTQYQELDTWTLELLASAPFYNPAWLETDMPEKSRLSSIPAAPAVDSLDLIRNQIPDIAVTIPDRVRQANRYLEGVPGTHGGQAADSTCCNLVLKLMYGFALPVGDALPLLLAWGQREDQLDQYGNPYPWNEAQLQRKLDWAAGQTYSGTLGDRLNSSSGPQVMEAASAVVLPFESNGPTILNVFDNLSAAASLLPAPGSTGTNMKKSVPESLIQLALRKAELFHTPAKEAMASIQLKGRSVNCPVTSRTFERWLETQYYQSCSGKIANKNAVKSACSIIENQALEGKEIKLYKRTAWVDGVLYLDLANEQDDCVRISSAGWTVISPPPVKWSRNQNTGDLPRPERGGCLAELQPFVGTSMENWLLIQGWILDALKGRGPYLVLAVHGEQGSAKTYLCRCLKRLIDPVHKAELSRLPRDEEGFALHASSDLLLAYDNISALAHWQSDTLCCLATGYGTRKRTLYSNSEQTVYDAVSPILLNGIPDLAEHNDLVSRSITIIQPSLADSQRIEESVLDARFGEAKGRILGGILDLLVLGLAKVSSVKIDGLPRMADSVKWITACTSNADFLSAFNENQEQTIETTLDCSPLAPTLLAWLVAGPAPFAEETDNCRQGYFKGSNKTLLDALTQFLSHQGGASGKWPKSAKQMNNQLRRDAPALRKVGVHVEFGKTNGERWIELKEQGR